MARNETTLRLFRVLHYLETSRKGLQVKDIVQRLENDGYRVDRKTVHRDLGVLEELHFPLVKQGKGPTSAWKLEPFAEIKNGRISFSQQEILALFIARNTFSHLQGSPIYEHLNGLFMRIEKLLGKNCEILEELSNSFYFRPKMTWQNSVPQDVLDTVYSAVEEGHPLRIEYKAQNGPNAEVFANRNVGPECLYFADGGAYLIGMDLDKNEVRTYVLARIGTIEMDKSRTYEKRGINPNELFSDSIGVLSAGEPDNVHLKITGPVSRYIAERRVHPSQKIIDMEDGVHLKMYVKINSELVRWVLGLGGACKVVGPECLKAKVVDEAQRIIGSYTNRAA